jgi:hypothetical protein
MQLRRTILGLSSSASGIPFGQSDYNLVTASLGHVVAGAVFRDPAMLASASLGSFTGKTSGGGTMGMSTISIIVEHWIRLRLPLPQSGLASRGCRSTKHPLLIIGFRLRWPSPLSRSSLNDCQIGRQSPAPSLHVYQGRGLGPTLHP